MKNSPLLQSLNKPQQEAVSAPPSHMLVLAGAGSGKTRVLVHRIAWLIQHHHVSPHSILAVTFTNKAAHEMRGRIESLLGMYLGNMWVGTFHGLSHRLLRAHWQEAELPETFQILDSEDQYRLIRRIQRNLNLEEDKWPPKQSQWFINKQKEEGHRPDNVSNLEGSFFTETMIKIYKAYEDVCRRSGLVDFAELLLRSLELLQNNETIRAHYQDRFQHVLVDEFQDTNVIQYAWLRMFAGPHNYVMAVGDDDQSIYSWRGAKIENIHRFSNDFSHSKTIRLEQNYRSTQTILTAANAVIDNNTNRLGKKLWTDGDKGQPITLYAAFNERDESYYIVSCIKDYLQRGYKAKDVAVLYRSNAQSRILEERLIDSQIPYRIYGGQKFFERAEIKDALAYLRLIANRHDDAAFERIVNTPTRGIGNNTLSSLRVTARENAASLWQTAEYLLEANTLNARATNALGNFIELINAVDRETKDMALGEQTQAVLEQSGLIAHYKKDRSEKGLSRIENLEELVNATLQFKAENDLGLSPLASFLSHVALETGEEQAEAHSDFVSLMTLHAAKGLEYPIVFISGMEEELFPHRMSMNEPNGLEEERRLCYVGMTRAKEKLVLTYAECRYLHGIERFSQPSRFIHEIPDELIESIRPTPKLSRPTPVRPTAKVEVAGQPGLRVGQRVQHKKFGAGVLINYEGQGEHARIQVKFDKAGTKWLVASFAKLTPL
ncbi:DNA helicase II [Candidiatus Paracoxiella cheracis]|uniref:DNA helicase II n=1 Tax=Candidiatus Paracoxiella cheracis TaxID=3405120 RepID=UPI003BF4E200